MNQLLSAALLLLTLSTSYGQVGTWQSYTDMKNIRSIASSDNRIIAATSGGIFFYDVESGDYQKYTVVDGLASIDLTSVFIDSKKRVFAGSSDGYLNMFIPEVGWKTIPDIARSVSRPQRGIRVIKEYNGLLFVGTDFGLTVYDADAGEFRDTYSKFGSLPLNSGVNDVFFRNDTVWAATVAGIGYANLNNENLQDPSQWGSYTTADGLPSGIVTAISELRGQIAVGTKTGISILNVETWGPSNPEFTGEVVSFKLRDGDLYIGTPYESYKMGVDGTSGFIGEHLRNGNYQNNITLSGLEVAGDLVFIATNYGVGFTQDQSVTRDPWEFKYPNGPNSNQFISMSIDMDGNLWSASGRDGLGQGIYRFDGALWTNYTKENTSAILTNDVVYTAPAPNGDMWFGTWGWGLLRYERSGRFTAFNAFTLPSYPGIAENPKFSPISGLSVDRNGNVYSLHNLNIDSSVSRFSPDGVWRFYRSPNFPPKPDPSGLTIDEFNNKWIIMKNEAARGVFVFNENNTLDDGSDDTWTRLVTSSSSELLADQVSSIVVDGFGDVWLGTNAGIRTIFNPQEPTRVTRTCYNTRCNIEGEAITCLAVDPVNNKWIGTNSGVFVLSNDGSTILNQFNTNNSLLLDNKITSIAVHPTTGVVYIGTNKGLSAYTTPYQKAQAEFTDLKIYPNPFKPKADLEVSIQGLVEESSVKILSVSGNLVAEFTTPGGNIGFWNGKTSDGKWAPSGIYYVAAYSADGKKAAVGKVAVINE